MNKVMFSLESVMEPIHMGTWFATPRKATARIVVKDTSVTVHYHAEGGFYHKRTFETVSSFLSMFSDRFKDLCFVFSADEAYSELKARGIAK